MATSRTLLSLLALVAAVNSHLNIVYPGSRGYNLATNGTVAETNGLSIGKQPGTNNTIYPYGEQWLFPCGGLPVGTNRTAWPVTGTHQLSFMPGLQAGHSTALLYVNLGLGTIPVNYSLPMVPVFNVNGPTNAEYNDNICLPEVPLPNGVSVNVGDNATIQIVEAAKHGAALYSCVDITFVPATEVKSVDCANSSGISITAVSTSANRWGWYTSAQMIGVGLGTGLPLLIIIAVLSFFLWKARKQLRTAGKSG